MKVTSLRDIPELPPGEAPPRKVAIGTFDGVHMGHREVIRGNDTVLTFNPHPLSVLAPEKAPPLVMPHSIQRDVIGGLGVEELVVIPFDRDFSLRTAEEFVEHVLVGQLGATSVSVGENFHFGHKAKGSPDFLRSREEFETRVVSADRGGRRAGVLDPHPRAGHHRRRGRRGQAAGRPVHPAGRRSCTARSAAASWATRPPTSCPARDSWCPRPGVYAGWANQHPAAINVGVRPTFQSSLGLLVEPYLLDFDGDLYGQELKVAFAERLRGEEKFDSVDALKEQMAADVQRTRELLAG